MCIRDRSLSLYLSISSISLFPISSPDCAFFCVFFQTFSAVGKYGWKRWGDLPGKERGGKIAYMARAHLQRNNVEGRGHTGRGRVARGKQLFLNFLMLVLSLKSLSSSLILDLGVNLEHYTLILDLDLDLRSWSRALYEACLYILPWSLSWALCLDVRSWCWSTVDLCMSLPSSLILI